MENKTNGRKHMKISLCRVSFIAPWPVAIPENSYQHSAPMSIANVIDGQLRHVVSGMDLVPTHQTHTSQHKKKIICQISAVLSHPSTS